MMVTKKQWMASRGGARGKKKIIINPLIVEDFPMFPLSQNPFWRA